MKCFQHENGFTLLEVLIWIVIGIVLVISTMQLLGANAAFSSLSDQRLNATVSAQKLVDLLAVEVYAAINGDESVLERVVSAYPSQYVADYNHLLSLNTNGSFYNIEPSEQYINGHNRVVVYKITVVSYYGQGKHHVRIDYFIEHQQER